jgi:hypothetical protein
VHVAALSVSEMLPAPHGVQMRSRVADGAACTLVPDTHMLCVEHERAPLWPAYLPTGHATHEPWLVRDWCVPAMHSSHLNAARLLQYQELFAKYLDGSTSWSQYSDDEFSRTRRKPGEQPPCVERTQNHYNVVSNDNECSVVPGRRSRPRYGLYACTRCWSALAGTSSNIPRN